MASSSSLPACSVPTTVPFLSPAADNDDDDDDDADADDDDDDDDDDTTLVDAAPPDTA